MLFKNKKRSVQNFRMFTVVNISPSSVNLLFRSFFIASHTHCIYFMQTNQHVDLFEKGHNYQIYDRNPGAERSCSVGRVLDWGSKGC